MLLFFKIAKKYCIIRLDVVNYIKKGCESMINVKELKLKKIFNLKEYLQEKARIDREYYEYVKEGLREAEEDFVEGRYCTLEEFKKYMEEELGMKHYD